MTSTYTHIVEHLEDLVHHNLVNEALIATADYFKWPDLVEVFERYLIEQTNTGYMTSEAIFRRSEDKKELLLAIELEHGEYAKKLFKSLL